MIFDPLPRYPRGVRFRLCTHTHTHTGGETAAGGWKEEGCRWDRYLDARNRWISGSRTIPGVLQCSGTLKTSRDNGAEWATAAWHAALPRASLSLSLSVCLSIHLSLSLPPWRDKVEEENEFIVGRVKFWWKIFSNVHIFNEVESARLFPSSRADSLVEEYLLLCLFICCVSTISLDFDTRWHFRLLFIYIDFIKIK